VRLAPGLVLIVLLAVIGCGDKSTTLKVPKAEGPIGEGASGVWIFQPAGKAKNLVVYFHGQGGPTEATPQNHLPWIEHLVERGSVVLYPRYEMTYEVDPMQYVLEGVKTAAKRVDLDRLPVLAIGYSRGGPLAVEYGAVAKGNGLPVPNSILSVFPAGLGNQQKIVDLTPLDHSTALTMQVGTDDDVVGRGGAAYLAQRLQQAGFPGDRILVDVVASHGSFTANHLAPLRTSPGAKQAFWNPADEILTSLEQG
jgi:predicted alpha/beta-hydrolase family hydrolase